MKSFFLNFFIILHFNFIVLKKNLKKTPADYFLKSIIATISKKSPANYLLGVIIDKYNLKKHQQTIFSL